MEAEKNMLTSILYINQQEFNSPKMQFKIKYFSAPGLYYIESVTIKVPFPTLQIERYHENVH